VAPARRKSCTDTMASDAGLVSAAAAALVRAETIALSSARFALDQPAKGVPVPLDVPRRCGRTDPGGALGREALDVPCRCARTGAVARSAARPSMPPWGRAVGTGSSPASLTRRRGRRAVPVDVPRRALSWRARTDGVFWDRELSITGPFPARSRPPWRRPCNLPK
jgi:hypothetical protein